jgi:cyclic-di-GMP phosphodiesterase TipF (flagellum assembly factor)
MTKLNLEVLAGLGFRYIKVDGQNLLEMPREENIPAPVEAVGAGGVDTMVEAKDEADTVVGIDVALLKRTMDIQGIDLIVEKLEEEQDLIELLDFRIDYGQGYLFGEPRLSK